MNRPTAPTAGIVRDKASSNENKFLVVVVVSSISESHKERIKLMVAKRASGFQLSKAK